MKNLLFDELITRIWNFLSNKEEIGVSQTVRIQWKFKIQPFVLSFSSLSGPVALMVIPGSRRAV